MLLPKVVTIILNWNKPDETIDCLESLKHLDYSNLQVLVIDNGSQDESAKILGKFVSGFSAFTFLETGENLGFSGGVNYGIRAALQQGADYIWLLNNDTEVASDCLKSLVKAMQAQAQVAIAGSKIFLHHQRDEIWHAGATFSKYTGQPRHLGMGASDDDPAYLSNRAVDYVTGCSLLIRKIAIDEIGVMDDRFFLYYEEADLCYRSRHCGWQVLYVADSKLWHKVATSSSYSVRTYYEIRNRLLFTFKHRRQKLLLTLLCLLFQELAKPLVKGNYKMFRAAVSGLADFFRLKFGKIQPELERFLLSG